VAAVRRGTPRAKVISLGPDSAVLASWPLVSDDSTLGTAGDVRLTDPCAAPVQGHFIFRGALLSFIPERVLNGTFLLIRRELPVAPTTELRVGRQLLRLDVLAPQKPSSELIWGSPNPGYRFRIQQILAGGLDGDSFPIKEGENLIGRAAGDLSFPGDGYVSSRHATLTVRGDQVMLKDLGSSNGTFVRLEAETSITPGDLLLVGEQLLRVDPP
jgi:hypothetical protein